MVRRLLIISACVVAGGVLAPVLLVKLVAFLYLGDWNRSLTAFDQTVYKPSVDAVGDVRCGFLGQYFRLDTADGHVVAGVIPRKEGDTEYLLEFSVSLKAHLVEEIVSVTPALDVTGGGAPRLLDLQPMRQRPVQRGGKHGTYGADGIEWSQDYVLMPDLDPARDTELLLRLSVVYVDLSGKRHVFDVKVPLHPIKQQMAGGVV